MEIVNELKLDMLNRSMPPVVNAVQDDSMTRKLKIEFYEGATAWNPADFDRISIAFLKPDGKRGWYDTLPNHSPAVVSAVEPVSGKLVSITATLAPEVLTTAGKVDVAIIFQDKSLNQIATFPFIVDVAENPANNQKISNDYYNVKNLTEINAELTRLNGSIISLEEETSWNYADSIRSTVTGKELSINDISRNRHMVICEVSSPTQRPEKIKVKVVTPDNPQGKIFAPSSDGKVTGVYSGYPTMQITTNTPDAMLKVVYNVDTRKFVEANASGGSGVEPEYVNNNFANVIKETITGTAVSTNMVSPIEHDVVCKVNRKNLVSPQIVYENANDYKIVVEDGRDCVSFNSGNTGLSDFVNFEPNAQYTVSFDVKVINYTGTIFAFVYSDGKSDKIVSQKTTGWEHIVRTSALGKTVKNIGVLVQDYRETTFIDIDTFIFEKGSVATPYIPYIPDLSSVTVTQNPGGKTFKPNADGVVTGMKSISPSMTILTDNPGANLEVTYNVDTKSYISSIINDEEASKITTYSSEKEQAIFDDIYARIGGGGGDKGTYGVECDMTNSVFTRLADAEGLTAGKDFDKIKAFGGRRRCNLTDDGKVVCYYGEKGFTVTGALTEQVGDYPIGTNAQVMVEQPKFYYKVIPIETVNLDGQVTAKKIQYYVSDTEKPGFRVHPAFIENGHENDKIYLSAFEGTIYDQSARAYILDDAQIANFQSDKLCSIANAKPASGASQNLSRANARNLAHNRGDGWEQQYIATLSASQLLILVEYAQFNMQSVIGSGATVGNSGHVVQNTGRTISLGDDSGSVTADGGSQSVSYRGEENIWGNLWKFVDGINVYNYGTGTVYVSDHEFRDNINKEPYKNTGIHESGSQGYISAFGYNELFDWLFIPAEVAGNSALPVGSYYYNDRGYSGYTAVCIGDSVNDTSDKCNPFSFNSNLTNTQHSWFFGTRCVFIPSKLQVAKSEEVITNG